MQNENKNIIYLMGITLILLSITIVSYDFYKKNKKLETKEFLVDLYINETSEIDNDKLLFNDEIFEISPTEQYSMILEIKSIELKQGMFDIDSYKNNVDYGLEILNKSEYPNLEKSNTIIASHSGNSSVSYFKNLNNIAINDIASLYYESIKYNYILKEVIDVQKTGEIILDLDTEKNSLILITCKRNSNEQLVFIFYLQNIEKY